LAARVRSSAALLAACVAAWSGEGFIASPLFAFPPCAYHYAKRRRDKQRCFWIIADGRLESFFQGASLLAGAIEGIAGVLADFFIGISDNFGGAAGGFARGVSGVSDTVSYAVSRGSNSVRDVVHNVRGLVSYCLIILFIHDSLQKISEAFRDKPATFARRFL
jgi:hypothetical protein